MSQFRVSFKSSVPCMVAYVMDHRNRFLHQSRIHLSTVGTARESRTCRVEIKEQSTRAAEQMNAGPKGERRGKDAEDVLYGCSH